MNIIDFPPDKASHARCLAQFVWMFSDAEHGRPDTLNCSLRSTLRVVADGNKGTVEIRDYPSKPHPPIPSTEDVLAFLVNAINAIKSRNAINTINAIKSQPPGDPLTHETVHRILWLEEDRKKLMYFLDKDGELYAICADYERLSEARKGGGLLTNSACKAVHKAMQDLVQSAFDCITSEKFGKFTIHMGLVTILTKDCNQSFRLEPFSF